MLAFLHFLGLVVVVVTTSPLFIIHRRLSELRGRRELARRTVCVKGGAKVDHVGGSTA